MRRIAGARSPKTGLFRRLLAHQGGNSLIEFGIVAPVLIILLLGMMDVVPLAIARSKLTEATQTSGDLAAATSQMQTADMANVFAAATQVMQPLQTSSLVLRVSIVYSDGAGHAKIYWSCGQGSLAPLVPNSQITQTANGTSVDTLLYLYNTGSLKNGTNTSFIMVESAYVANPGTSFILKGSVPLVGAAYLLPRQSAYVGFPWDGTYNNQPKVPNTTTTDQSVAIGTTISCRYAA